MFFTSLTRSRTVKIPLKKVLRDLILHIIIFNITSNLIEPTRSHPNGI